MLWTLPIAHKMSEKWSQITHILEREDREFEEAMRGQIGCIFPSAKGSSNRGSFKMFTSTGVITQCTTRNK